MKVMERINNTTLVIMAAGIGSRFENGIKQLAPINDKGETIMELSIKNAEKVGFNKVVFIIRKELQKYFDENIIPKINLKYEYAYQEIDSKRSKPWGTGHALLSIKNIVKENFCLINSDDYYSYDSFEKVYKYLNNNSNVMVGYKLKNTIFVDKGVNRGICHIKDNKLVNIDYDKISVDGYYTDENKYQYAGYIISNKTDEGYRYGYISAKGKLILKSTDSDV